MRRWHFVCLLLIQGTLNALQTQAPRGIEDCLPYPTLAQELKHVRNEQSLQASPTPTIKIQRADFRGDVGLGGPELQQIAASLEKLSWDDDSDWVQEINDRVADAWRHRGYFQHKVNVEQHELGRNAQTIDVGLTIHVDAGRQYRLGDMHFFNGKQFPAEQLRRLFPIHAGEVFDTHKIQRGIENLRKLYAGIGFINFTAVPDTQIDRQRQRITLTIDMEEGKQFHISNVSVAGLDSKLASRLLEESTLRTGEIFNQAKLEDFFTRNKAGLPPDARPEDDTERVINEADGTVSLRMNFLRFQGCPKLDD
jgi:outer membrane protein assembly factor BamA